MNDLRPLSTAILDGDAEAAATLAHQAAGAGPDAADLAFEVSSAIQEAGRRFDAEESFLPDLARSARAAREAQPAVPAGRVVVGAPCGVSRDLDKDLAAAVLESGGFEVLDLGADVLPERFAEAAGTHNPDLVCLSAALPASIPGVRSAVDALRRADPHGRVKILVGGTAADSVLAREIGADGYWPDARALLRLARETMARHSEHPAGAYDATVLADWQIAEAAEKHMPSPSDWRSRLGLEKDEVIPMGRVAKLDFLRIIDRLKDRPDGQYIEVTAITPTPLGEGKSTTSLGLIEGLGKRGRHVGGCLRQPSGGPTMNIKGTAAGGGNALLIPMTEFSMGLTGDINDVMNAHNLAMVALTARMQHERNYNDDQLRRLTGMRRLDVDPTRVEMGWVLDFCAQALRSVIVGIGARTDGYMMQSKFGIAVSSELMAILAIVRDLKDLRQRLGDITVAYDKRGNAVTAGDLEVAGAMCAWMRNAINPTLCSTAEYQPVMVHAGPFANIAVGQSSIIGDRVGLKLFDYHVTESGFAADIGFEKFWNVKCRLSGLQPRVSVLTTTIRSLKMHGGGPKVVPGLTLADEYRKENLKLVEAGLPNMLHHIGVIRKSGINPVVCINRFETDTADEIRLVRRAAEGAGARCALSSHWAKGGEGALELADAVIDAVGDVVSFRYLYPMEMKLRDRVELIASEVYGADGVAWAPEAEEKLKVLESDRRYDEYSTMMVKTHLSLSHDPALKGVPRNWILPIRDVLVYSGARFLCPCAGAISLMPGTSSNPGFRRVDVDVQTGQVTGLF
jgi:formate--tetrahydrofolate ligase